MSNIERDKLTLPSGVMDQEERIKDMLRTVRTEATLAAIYRGLSDAEFMAHGTTRQCKEDKENSHSCLERLEEYVELIIREYEEAKVCKPAQGSN